MKDLLTSMSLTLVWKICDSAYDDQSLKGLTFFMWLKYIFFLDTSDHKDFVGLHAKNKKLALVLLSKPLSFEPLGVSKQKFHLKRLLLKCPCVAFEKIFLLFVTIISGSFDYFPIL